MESALNFLKENNIEYKLHKHPAVHTVADSQKLCLNIPGLRCKNLFLKEKKGYQFFLVVVPAEKRTDLDKLAKQLDVKKLTFGSPEKLKELLNLTPGSVSPLGMIYSKGKVKLIIDQEVWQADVVNFHPNINTASLEINKEMFHRLVGLFGCDYLVLNIPERMI